MNNIERLGDGNYLVFRGDDWVEVWMPGEHREKGKPHVRILLREVMGSMEFHTFAVRQCGAVSHLFTEIDSEVNYECVPMVIPLIEGEC